MPKLGVTSKLYYNADTYGSPDWTELSCLSDVGVNGAWDEAQGDTRGSRIKMVAKTMMGVEISAKAKVSNTETGYIALWDALHSDTPLDILILNGSTTENGARGYRMDFHVMSGNEDQAMANALYLDLMLKPAVSDNAPKKAVVASGAPVFTAIPA